MENEGQLLDKADIQVFSDFAKALSEIPVEGIVAGVIAVAFLFFLKHLSRKEK